MEIIGKYRLEKSDLYQHGGEIHLRTGKRFKARKGAGIRYIGEVGKDDSFKYISSLYPTGKRNTYRLEHGGEALELEITAKDEVEIKPIEEAERLALVYQEAQL